MILLTRKETLEDIFKDIEPNEKKLIVPLIDEVIFLEEQMNELKKLPFIRINAQNPALQKKTEAAKLYKECTQSYMNAIRILCSILHKVESTAQEELLKRLAVARLDRDEKVIDLIETHNSQVLYIFIIIFN